MDLFLHGYKNIFSSPCNYMLNNPSSADPPTYTTQLHADKPIQYRLSNLYTRKTILFPNVELFQLARNSDIIKNTEIP